MTKKYGDREVGRGPGFTDTHLFHGGPRLTV